MGGDDRGGGAKRSRGGGGGYKANIAVVNDRGLRGKAQETVPLQQDRTVPLGGVHSLLNSTPPSSDKSARCTFYFK